MVLSYIQLGVIALVLCLNTSVYAGICGKLHLKGLCRLLTHGRHCGKGNMREPCMIPPQYDLTDQGEASNQSGEELSQSGEAFHESNQEPSDPDEEPTDPDEEPLDLYDDPIEVDDTFCDIKCREGGLDLLTSLCVCVTTSTKIATTRTTIPPTTTERATTTPAMAATTTTTTETATTTTEEVPTTTTEGPTTSTTPRPEMFYYTRNRPAQLGTVVKRMYCSTECEYPGVVGISNGNKVFQFCSWMDKGYGRKSKKKSRLKSEPTAYMTHNKLTSNI